MYKKLKSCFSASWTSKGGCHLSILGLVVGHNVVHLTAAQSTRLKFSQAWSSPADEITTINWASSLSWFCNCSSFSWSRRHGSGLVVIWHNCKMLVFVQIIFVCEHIYINLYDLSFLSSVLCTWKTRGFWLIFISAAVRHPPKLGNEFVDSSQ